MYGSPKDGQITVPLREESRPISPANETQLGFVIAFLNTRWYILRKRSVSDVHRSRFPLTGSHLEWPSAREQASIPPKVPHGLSREVHYGMQLSLRDLENQKKLKRELQDGRTAVELEKLTAALVGRLLGVPIAVARPGPQHGGDAGPAGLQERRFRLECKKYGETSHLSDRELLGEIDQALARDEALEAWVLVATISVPEQLVQALTKKGEGIGVPVVILDWRDAELALLAALCAFDPDLVEAEFSKEAGALARLLQCVSTDAIAMLRRDLQSWCLGFDAIRMSSHERLERIWNLPRESNAELGQNAAGGARAKRVRRRKVHEALYAWWRGSAQTDAPAVIVGWDGVGKTWATLDWLVDSKSEQPIILVVPSSAVVSVSVVSRSSVEQFLAQRLYDLTDVRDPAHWLRRLRYLLKRPADEGPVLTVFFDGLNQEPSVDWLSLLRVLQGETFAGRVRVVLSTRTYHFDDRLSKLHGLSMPPIPVAVDIYDAAPGGELDEMLAFESLVRADLQTDVLELARTPRLFELVVRLRARLGEPGQVTVHMLLWEYGRDTLEGRAQKSFTEDDWKAWLQEVAKKYRDGMDREVSVKSLGDMVSRRDLSEREVYRRLSDIIDGRFVCTAPSGKLQLTPTVVVHALGATLLAHLEEVTTQTFLALDCELIAWLDPIAGFDQRAEVLRAAVSIVVEGGSPAMTPLAGVLVTAWLQTQNIPDAHRRELVSLAPQLTDALLDAVEHSHTSTHASARLWAVKGLRAIPRTDAASFGSIATRIRHWFSIVSREVYRHPEANPDVEKRRSDHFRHLIGVDFSGPIRVVGVELELVDQTDCVLQALAPSIIEGFPLANALPIFEVAVVAFAIGPRDEGWDGLKWICLLNEVDPDETAEALRDRSEELRHRTPELGIHPDLGSQAAALLLFLSGEERDEDVATSINPVLGRVLSYEKDYLPRPGRSFFFPLERRHAEVVLNDTGLPLLARVQRTEELWLDPTFEPPAAFVTEVRALVANIEVNKLDRGRGRSIEDYNFQELEPVLARCAPDLLADLVRRKMQSMAVCPPDSRYWRALNATHCLVLAGETESAAARTLRLGGKEAESGECYAASRLLIVELQGLDTQAQFDEVIRASLEYISIDFTEVLRVPTPQDVDALIARYAVGSSKQQDDLLNLLSIHPVEFGDRAWSWIEGFAKQEGRELRGLAFRTLTISDATRFGRTLADEDWSWSPDAHPWENHYGTGALIEATRALPFEQVAPRLAPWRLLDAVRLRGADPTEIRLAAGIFNCVFAAENIAEPDPGSDLSVDRTKTKSLPFTFSVSPRPSQEETRDPLAALEAAMDTDAQIRAHRRAAEIADSRIREARKSGAGLYLANVDAEDFVPVLQQASDTVDFWLEGLVELTADFQRRVLLAEGAFLALCEVLLARDPERGAQLWRALRRTMRTRYSGAADVDELLHIVFRAPDSPAVTDLREEQIGLRRCHTDQALFDLALAASYNGKADWLTAIIETDRVSPLVWKRKRSLALAGSVANNTLPVAGAWPDGEIRTGHLALERGSGRRRWSEACAHHWWLAYLKANNPAKAYAAWVLFLNSTDKRAWIWMHEDTLATDNASAFFKLKLSHVALNQSRLKRAMEKRVDKFDENFLARKIVTGLGPWGKAPESFSPGG